MIDRTTAFEEEGPLLVTAIHLALDRTSEGICTRNFLNALGGPEVICLSSDAPSDSIGFPVEQLSKSPKAGRLFAERLDAVSRRHHSVNNLVTAATFATGRSLGNRQDIADWSHSLVREIDRHRPRLVFVRGAGLNFDPHKAMAEIDADVPWVAHHHDPAPISRYPPPYAQIRRVLSSSQERDHMKMMSAATALTFPSTRLLEWMTNGQQDLRRKSFVLPHVVSQSGRHLGELDAEVSQAFERFENVLLHAGTLLKQRDPTPLVTAFEDEIATLGPGHSWGLVLVGPHFANTQVATSPNVVFVDRRLHYEESKVWMKAATANVIVEAAAVESPFFPGKLADAIWAGRPIIALTPACSVIRDILGPDYPLLALPGDVEGIRRVIRRAIKSGTSDCLPSTNAIAAVAPQRVPETLSQIRSFLAI